MLRPLFGADRVDGGHRAPESHRLQSNDVGSTGYRLLLLAHVASVIVGYGAVVFDSILGARATRMSGAEAHAVAQAGYRASVHVAQRALYLVPLAGIGVVLTHPNPEVDFSSPWVSAAFVVYVASLGVLHGLVTPARRKALVLLGELAGRPDSDNRRPPEQAQVESLGRRMQLGEALFHLLTVAALVLMIWQPGQ